MSTPEETPDPSNAGLNRMGRAIRRGKTAFEEADAAFEEAMEGLIVLTKTHGTMQAQLTDLRESVSELQRVILDQGQEIRSLRAIVAEQASEIHALRERLNGGGAP